MPLRIPPQVRHQLFSTSSRARSTVPLHFNAYNPNPHHVPPTPKLGRIARWYLPTMALIAVGMIYLPANPFLPVSETASSRTVTLDAANRRIGFAIMNALGDHNKQQNQNMSQEERNMMLLDAYGERNSLEDLENAFNGHGVLTGGRNSRSERHRLLTEAYGERKSLRDVERALEVYEVQ